MKRRQGRSWYWLYEDEQKDEGGPGTGCIRTRGEIREVVLAQVVSGREERETRNVVLALFVSGWEGRQGRSSWHWLYQSERKDEGGSGTICIGVRKRREVLAQVTSA